MNHISHLFTSLDRHDRFMYGITLTIIINIALGSALDMHTGRTSQGIVQGLLVGIAIGLLFHYHHYRDRTFFAIAGIIAASIGYDLLLYFDRFELYSYLIPLIMPLVFFFLVSLKEALVVSVIHYIGLIALSGYAYYFLHLSSAMFDPHTIQAYMFSAIFVVAIGVFYQLGVEKTYRELIKTNAQKDLLLKEIHHRIKNNLNKMASALGLQILRLHQGYREEPEAILSKNKLRIETMALVHEALYRSDDLTNVGAEKYIRELIDLIGQTYDYHQPVTVKAKGISLPIEKILRLGTILNELYTNTVKHAPGQKVIQVTISINKDKSRHVLAYTQVGDFDAVSTEAIEKTHGLGMMLVKLSIQEMDGTLVTISNPGYLKFEFIF